MIYLHHYPASLFSEKIRVMLGYLAQPWRSVVIPSIMPRPLLMPLTGGYRKTPCLQIGANVYCDTTVIAHGLARHTGDATLFAPGFPAHRVAAWADSRLFQVTVALNFAPEAVGAAMSQLSPEEVAAFAKDRAELGKGGTLQPPTPSVARAELEQALVELEGSLGQPFLFGSAPSIADFSVYHCLWFIAQNPTNAPILDSRRAVRSWMDRIAAFGHGDVTESSGEQALAHAKEQEPIVPELEPSLPAGIAIGERVAVTPTDYGLIPVEGKLAACGVAEVAVERAVPEAGRVLTHFPRASFEISPR